MKLSGKSFIKQELAAAIFVAGVCLPNAILYFLKNKE